MVLAGMGTTGASGLDESGLTEVSNQRGDPVAGATVMAYRNPSPAKVKSMSPGDVYEAEPEFVAVTDSAGLVDLPELPDRRRDYSLVVVGDGLVTESMYIDELDSDGAQLAAAGTRNRIRVRTTRRAARLAQRCRTSTRESRELIDKDNVPAEVGRVFSRTGDARVDFRWSVGNTLSLGVGVRHDNGRVSGGASTMRTIDNTVEASFPALRAKGERVQRIQVKYIYWKITTTVVRSCDSGATVTKKVRWEWVPEGLNGGSGTSYKIDKTPPPPPDKDNCANLKKGKWQNVTRGKATRLDGSVSVGGFSLSAQAGYNDSMSVKTTAEDRIVRTCGYHGPAATDPGQLVAIKG